MCDSTCSECRSTDTRGGMNVAFDWAEQKCVRLYYADGTETWGVPWTELALMRKGIGSGTRYEGGQNDGA
jgi:hypothetical protein